MNHFCVLYHYLVTKRYWIVFPFTVIETSYCIIPIPFLVLFINCKSSCNHPLSTTSFGTKSSIYLLISTLDALGLSFIGYKTLTYSAMVILLQFILISLANSCFLNLVSKLILWEKICTAYSNILSTTLTFK